MTYKLCKAGYRAERRRRRGCSLSKRDRENLFSVCVEARRNGMSEDEMKFFINEGISLARKRTGIFALWKMGIESG